MSALTLFGFILTMMSMWMVMMMREYGLVRVAKYRA